MLLRQFYIILEWNQGEKGIFSERLLGACINKVAILGPVNWSVVYNKRSYKINLHLYNESLTLLET